MQLPLKINGWDGFVLKFRAISEFYIEASLKKPPRPGLAEGRKSPFRSPCFS